MGAIDEQFPRMRDTRANILEEIQSVLFCSDVPLTVKGIRIVLRDRHEWIISFDTVKKFVLELIDSGKVVRTGKILIDGHAVESYTLNEKERDVRRRGCRTDAVSNHRTVYG